MAQWRRNQIILIRLKLLYFFFDFISQVHGVLLHTESSALHNWTHFGDWLVLSFKIHSALFGKLKSRLNGKSWIRRKTNLRSARGDSHPPRSPLGLRQPLILAKGLHGWRKPDREDNPPKLPIRLRVAACRYRFWGLPLPPPPELIPSFPPISHLKSYLDSGNVSVSSTILSTPHPCPRPLSKCDIFHHQAFGGKWNLGVSSALSLSPGFLATPQSTSGLKRNTFKPNLKPQVERNEKKNKNLRELTTFKAPVFLRIPRVWAALTSAAWRLPVTGTQPAFLAETRLWRLWIVTEAFLGGARRDASWIIH